MRIAKARGQRKREKPLKVFVYARRLRYVQPGRINWFRYRGAKIKAYVPSEGREIQILDVPEAVRGEILRAYKIRLVKGSIRIVRERKQPIDLIEMNRRFRQAWEEGWRNVKPKLMQLQSEGWMIKDIRSKRRVEELKRRLQDGSEVETVTVAEWMGEPIEVVVYRPKSNAKKKPNAETRTLYPLEDRRRLVPSHDDMRVVADQMRFLERISGFFEPLTYKPVPTILVDEDYIDQICPPKLERGIERFRWEIERRIDESVKREYEDLYSKAVERGIELEKIPIHNWREYIGKLLDFCGSMSELFPEESYRLKEKIRRWRDLRTLEENIYILVSMGCFCQDPLSGKEVVFLCPERIKGCPDALRTVQEFEGWVESLENPLHVLIPRSYPTGIEHVYRFVLIHEHAHAATVPRRRPSQTPDIIRTMNEGIAQWITFKVLEEAGMAETLALFEDHAEALPEEYNFYKPLNHLEARYGREAVISAILCWTQAPDLYRWEEFIDKLKNNKGTPLNLQFI